MQFDPYTCHTHTLFFETQVDAYAAHNSIVHLVGVQVEAWNVQEGGRRTFVVLDRPAPTGTWQYLFVTTGPLTDTQMNQIHLATLSTGNVIEHPRHYRKAEEKLACAQQALSRKKRGSNRRKKAVQRVGKLHRKVANQRKDSLHKHSRWLVDTYETIIFEDIKPAHLSKRPKPKQDAETGQYLPNHASAKAGLNKSILDAGWTLFISMCTYKAACAGRTFGVVKVSPYKTSQRCSRCGKEGPHLDLRVRTFTCVHCGVVLDRDHNASLNIQQLWLGQSLQGTRP